jgi:hypothetical protein
MKTTSNGQLTLFDFSSYQKTPHPDDVDLVEDKIPPRPKTVLDNSENNLTAKVSPKSSHVEREPVERAKFYHWVEEYPVKQKYYYWRYSYLHPNDITKVEKIHIPGGKKYHWRTERVKEAIALGKTPEAIANMIKSWR